MQCPPFALVLVLLVVVLALGELVRRLPRRPPPAAARLRPPLRTTVAQPAATAAPPRRSRRRARPRSVPPFGLAQPELDALNKMTETYQKTHPNVEVEWINITGGGPYGRDKLQTMIAGGDAPDLMMLNTGQYRAISFPRCAGAARRYDGQGEL